MDQRATFKWFFYFVATNLKGDDDMSFLNSYSGTLNIFLKAVLLT